MIDSPSRPDFDAIDVWLGDTDRSRWLAVMERVYQSELEFLRDRLGIDIDDVRAVQRALDDAGVMARLSGHNAMMIMTFAIEDGLTTLERLNTQVRSGIGNRLEKARLRAEDREFRIACLVAGSEDRKVVEKALKDGAIAERVRTLVSRPDGILERMRERFGRSGRSLR